MKEEWKRQIKSPLFWGLMIGSLLINFWILANYSGQRELVVKSREAWMKLNLPVNETSVQLYLKELESVEERKAGVPGFKQVLDGALYMQQELDGQDLADVFSTAFMLRGEALKYVEEEYGKLDKVLEYNRRDGTAAMFFVPGNRGFFELYSRQIPLFCTLESILAAVLLMMKSVNEPFSVGTAMVVFATKTGRKSQDKRRRAAVLTSVVFAVGVWAVTCLSAGILFPMGNLWKTRVGSMMLLDSFFPIISRFPMTVAAYLGLEFGISVLSSVLFCYLSYIFAARNQNSFASFVQLMFGCACIYTVTSLFPKDSRFFFTVQYNPVSLIQRAGHWVVSGGPFFSPQYYEITVLLLWGSLIGIAVYLSRRRFLREDL